jgi:hypothetical protein
LQTDQVVSGFLRGACGGEDRPVIVFQNLEPRGKILRVVLSRLNVETEMRARKRGRQLCDQFFGRIGFIAKPAGEFVIATLLCTGPVAVMPISA